MSDSLYRRIIRYIERSLFLLVTSSLVMLILFFMSGCGAKKKAAEELAPAKERILTPAQKRIAAWHALMREKRGAPEMEKLKSVNSFFNNLEFVDDKYLWGTEDYWATPQEMLTVNGGDCEDFATAKYFTLRHIEVPDEKMRLTYVKSLMFEQPHMVLSFYQVPTAEPLVLDSLIDAILPASRRSDLLPIYSFNGEGLWLTRKQSSERLRGSDNLSLWQDLQRRFNREAIAAPLPE